MEADEPRRQRPATAPRPMPRARCPAPRRGRSWVVRRRSAFRGTSRPSEEARSRDARWPYDRQRPRPGDRSAIRARPADRPSALWTGSFARPAQDRRRRRKRLRGRRASPRHSAASGDRLPAPEADRDCECRGRCSPPPVCRTPGHDREAKLSRRSAGGICPPPLGLPAAPHASSGVSLRRFFRCLLHPLRSA